MLSRPINSCCCLEMRLWLDIGNIAASSKFGYNTSWLWRICMNDTLIWLCATEVSFLEGLLNKDCSVACNQNVLLPEFLTKRALGAQSSAVSTQFVSTQWMVPRWRYTIKGGQKKSATL